MFAMPSDETKARFRCIRCAQSVIAESGPLRKRPRCCDGGMIPVERIERDDEQTQPIARTKVPCRGGQCPAEVMPGTECKWCLTPCPKDAAALQSGTAMMELEKVERLKEHRVSELFREIEDEVRRSLEN